MGFIQENTSSLNILKFAKNDVSCYFVLSKGIVVEGYKKLLEISDIKVTLLLPSGEKLQISGENLSIKELAQNEITVCGEVVSITKI